MSSVICLTCRNNFATKACLCTFPLPISCNQCFDKHISKSTLANHRTIPIEDSIKITSQQDLHEIKLRLVNIDEAENVLKGNMMTLEQCKTSIEEQFAMLIYDINAIKEQHLNILRQINLSIEGAILEAVGLARKHAIDSQWDSSVDNPLARKVWEFQVRDQSSVLTLFEYEVTRPPISLEKLIQVKMIGRTSLPTLPDKPVLSLIADQYLHRFDTSTQQWTGNVQLTGDLSSWTFSWDSALAHFSDNIHVLVTGGGNPLTNSVYKVNVMDGKVTELAHMRSSRSGHGLTQLRDLFYVFGGAGARRSAERFSPSEGAGSWDNLGNMNGSHQWLTTCTYKDEVYICGGDSELVEKFSPATGLFTVVEFKLLDAWAESSLSIGIIGAEVVFLSSSMIKKWNVEDNSSIDKKLVRPLRSAWSCMTPISNGGEKIYLPSQESKHVKCVNLITGRVEEFKAPQMEGD